MQILKIWKLMRCYYCYRHRGEIFASGNLCVLETKAKMFALGSLSRETRADADERLVGLLVGRFFFFETLNFVGLVLRPRKGIRFDDGARLPIFEKR